MKSSYQDIYEKITNEIISAIEKGVKDYRMPWHASPDSNGFPVNALSKRCYRGINVLSLWAKADALNYKSPYWATYKQWKELGAQVKKDEKSTLVVFWKFDDNEEEDEEENKSKKSFVLARGYHVFNASQVDGFTPPSITEETKQKTMTKAADFFNTLSADIRHGGSRAFYNVTSDYIQMPPFEAFHSEEGYYSVLSHEATHWTGAKHRLNRDFAPRFNSQAYAVEELVAELGAAFLCADLGVSNHPRKDHAGYIASYLTVLKNDKGAIFAAASKAQAAVDYLQPARRAASIGRAAGLEALAGAEARGCVSEAGEIRDAA